MVTFRVRQRNRLVRLQMRQCGQPTPAEKLSTIFGRLGRVLEARATLESSNHVGARDIMTALPHARRHPSQRELRRCETKIGDLDRMASSFP
jgi:hypothetical protein